jgi:CheY-like chemotaxis protein
MQEDRDKIFRVGMDDYLCKPVLFQDLIGKVAWYGQLGRDAAERELRRFLDSISRVAVRGMKGKFVAML